MSTLKAREARFPQPSARLGASQTHLCHQPLSAEVDVGQRERDERARGVLGQPAVAHLGKAPQPLDHAEHVLDARTDARLAAVLRPCGLIDFALPAHALVGEVAGPRRFASDQRLLARVGAVAIDALLGAVQQLGQRVLVVTRWPR